MAWFFVRNDKRKDCSFRARLPDAVGQGSPEPGFPAGMQQPLIESQLPGFLSGTMKGKIVHSEPGLAGTFILSLLEKTWLSSRDTLTVNVNFITWLICE